MCILLLLHWSACHGLVVEKGARDMAPRETMETPARRPLSIITPRERQPLVAFQACPTAPRLSESPSWLTGGISVPCQDECPNIAPATSPLHLCVMDARLVFLLLLAAAASAPLASAQLSADFYKTSCPDAEKIIFDVVQKRFKADPGTAAGLLRLVFHDCFANVRN
jgi:hypothetical protein